MGPVGEVLTSPICAQRASGYNSRVLTFPNPELKNAKAGFIATPPTMMSRPARNTRAHLSVIETSGVDLDEHVTPPERRNGPFHDTDVIMGGLTERVGLIL